VGFVDDNEIEVADTEAALTFAPLVDETHDRRIGGHEDAPFGVLLGDQVHR